MLLCDGFRKTHLDNDLIANAFRGSIQNTRLFSIFSSFIFCSIIYLFEKRKGAHSCLPYKDLFKGWFRLWSFYQYKMLLVLSHVDYIDVLKLRAYKLLKKKSDGDLSWLLFLKKPTSRKHIISCFPVGYREIAVKIFFDLTLVPPVKILIFMFLLSRLIARA